ncbi:MAG: hypothetical protein [Cressdnaviricota sp.]|nr:MAG: hypothetical protein [Cressdnaviricota sp.]
MSHHYSLHLSWRINLPSFNHLRGGPRGPRRYNNYWSRVVLEAELSSSHLLGVLLHNYSTHSAEATTKRPEVIRIRLHCRRVIKQ